MLRALTFLLFGSLLRGALCGEWTAIMPQKVETMEGSCVTVPCSFDIKNTFNEFLNNECIALWNQFETDPAITITQAMTGNLTEKNCTSTFNNMTAEYNNQYYFRLQCPNALKYSYNQRLVRMVVTEDPPTLNLSPSTLEVKEGSSVSLTCSAPAPCLTHPPTLTWTPSLGDVQEQLQENEDKTKVLRSVLNFTASHLLNGRNISCTAVYKKQDGSQDASVSISLTAAVSYSPKDIMVSVSPSGPVQQNSDVTLTCTSNANPAVRSYTWYRADGSQETVIGTKAVLKINASEVSGPFFCEATNDVGVGRSSLSQIDFQFPPQILPSSDCTKTAGQVNCSCETVGNPLPTLQWYLDGLPVNQSDKFVISNERLNNDKGLRSFIIVNQPQEMDFSTLLCHSFNSLGSASQRFCLENGAPAESQDQILLLSFITTSAILLALVCVLLCVIRTLKNRQNPNSHLTGKITQATKRQQAKNNTADPPNMSEPNSGANNAGVSKSSEKNGRESDVIYTTVKWKSENKKGEDSANMNPSGGSYLEEEKRMVGGVCKMGNLDDEVEPRIVRKEAECEYAQVKLKGKSAKKQ